MLRNTIKEDNHFSPYQHYRVTIRFVKDTVHDTLNDLSSAKKIVTDVINSIFNTKNNQKISGTRGNVVYRMFGEFNEEDYQGLLKKGLEGIKEIREENDKK